MMDIGVDIEDVHRFKSLIRNKRFLERVFTPDEIAYCRSKKNKLQHFAVRFAAKEAVWKALSAFLKKQRKTLGHRHIGVKNDSVGKPEVRLPAAFRTIAGRISLSLSHTQRAVVAVALFKR